MRRLGLRRKEDEGELKGKVSVKEKGRSRFRWKQG